MEFSFSPVSPYWVALLAACLGGVVGVWLDRRLGWMLGEPESGVGSRETAPHRQETGFGEARSPRKRWLRGWQTGLAVAALFGVYVLAVMVGECQRTAEVSPFHFWRFGRIGFHLVLLTALVAATLTDLADYVIPDMITLPATLFGILGAFISGDLQIIHLWVDWNLAQPGLAGPHIPAWIVEHHHWHGLAWSLAGAMAGGGMTWLARAVSSLVLGQEALGLGDVTLMVMVGSFLGWQPVIFVFLLAPFCGLFVGMVVKLVLNRPYVPYGPFLAAATVIVLFSWRWIWTWEPLPEVSIRRLFGDWPSLLILAAFVLLGLILLLGMVRIYRMIPGKARNLSE